MFKLNSTTFVVVGFVLILVAVGGFVFQKIIPTNTEIGYWQEQVAKLDNIISEPSKKQAVERVREAYATVQKAETNWKQVVQTRTPPEARINLEQHRWQTVVNTRRWVGVVESDLRKWIAKSGVRLIEPAGGLQVPFPTDQPNELVQYYFNFPAFPFPLAIWDLGPITVEGTYEQIMAHVRSWSLIPNYIAEVRGLSLTGTGPRIRGTYGLTLLVYINTKNVAGGPAQGGGVPDISGGEGGGQNTSGTMQRPGGGGPGAGGGGGGGGVGGKLSGGGGAGAGPAPIG